MSCSSLLGLRQLTDQSWAGCVVQGYRFPLHHSASVQLYTPQRNAAWFVHENSKILNTPTSLFGCVFPINVLSCPVGISVLPVSFSFLTSIQYYFVPRVPIWLKCQSRSLLLGLFCDSGVWLVGTGPGPGGLCIGLGLDNNDIREMQSQALKVSKCLSICPSGTKCFTSSFCLEPKTFHLV